MFTLKSYTISWWDSFKHIILAAGEQKEWKPAGGLLIQVLQGIKTMVIEDYRVRKIINLFKHEIILSMYALLYKNEPVGDEVANQ